MLRPALGAARGIADPANNTPPGGQARLGLRTLYQNGALCILFSGVQSLKLMLKMSGDDRDSRSCHGASQA